MKRVFDAGAGAVTTKSIGPVPRKGYNNPSIIEIYPGTFMNAVGLSNPGIDAFIPEIKEIKNHDIPLIVKLEQMPSKLISLAHMPKFHQ